MAITLNNRTVITIYCNKSYININSLFPKISYCTVQIFWFLWWYEMIKKNQRRQWHPTPVLLPGKSHGPMSLVGCSPWGRWESDTTEWLHFHFSLSCTGEGNGNPLQCSCLENPRDGGAWWAAVYGVAQRRTGLKWLSSSRDDKMPFGLDKMNDLGIVMWH